MHELRQQTEVFVEMLPQENATLDISLWYGSGIRGVGPFIEERRPLGDVGHVIGKPVVDFGQGPFRGGNVFQAFARQLRGAGDHRCFAKLGRDGRGYGAKDKNETPPTSPRAMSLLRDVGTPSGEKTAPKKAFFDPFFYCGSENEDREGGHQHGLCNNRREVRFIEH